MAAWELRLDCPGAARRDRPATIRLAQLTTLGRDPTAVDVHLDSTATLPGLLSRVHAQIEIEGDEAPVLHDCSLNGVRVDGTLISKSSVRLTEGAVIIFGAKARGAEAEFRYRLRRRQGSASSDATPRTGACPAKRPKLEGTTASAAGGASASTASAAGGTSTSQAKTVDVGAPSMELATSAAPELAADIAPDGKAREVSAARGDVTNTEGTDAGTSQASATAIRDDSTSEVRPAAQAQAEASEDEEAEEAEEVEAGGTAAGDIMYEELQCIVCKDLLCRPHTLGCSHTFCADCIFGWAKRDKSCIICREPLVALPTVVRQLDALTSKLAGSVLLDEERQDWFARAEAWDQQAAAAREAWLTPPEAAPAERPPPAEPEVKEVLAEYCSVRSSCRRCLRRIGEGELRYGVRSFVPMFGHSVVAWHHTRCLALGELVQSTAQVHGYEALRPREQKRLRKALES